MYFRQPYSQQPYSQQPYFRQLYSGWLIEIVEQEKGGYGFHGWLPDRQIGISDRRIYASSEQALSAAKSKIHLETAKLALEHCYWRGLEGDLDLQDYHFLIDFILGAIQHHENCTQTAH